MAPWSPASAALAQTSHLGEGAGVASRNTGTQKVVSASRSKLWLKERASGEGVV